MKKLVNNRLVNHIKKCGLSYDSQYVFRSSQSNADILAAVSDWIARAFNRSGATCAVALVYLRLLIWFYMLVFPTNSGLMEFQVGDLVLFHLFSVINAFKWFWMGNFSNNSQLMLEFSKAWFLVLHFFHLTNLTTWFYWCKNGWVYSWRKIIF